MTEADAARRRLDMYLGEVRGVLRALDPTEVQEILAELRSHVLDRVGGEARLTEASVQQALDGLGAPRALGAGYLGRSVAATVEKSRSPWRVLAAAYRLASFSAGAFALFIVSLFGYAIGAGLIVTALAKPFMPDRTGLWVSGKGGDLDISLGVFDRPHAPHTEVLGWWIIPIGLVLGVVLLLMDWRLGLAGVRALGRGGPRLESRYS
jgi:hypothetical protein